jgi:hypothetical protein
MTTKEKDRLAIDLSLVRDRMQHLVSLHAAKSAAATDFNEACKSVAQRAGIKPAVLAKYVSVTAADKVSEEKAKNQQLSLLLGD